MLHLFINSIYLFLAALFFSSVSYILFPHKKPSLTFSFSDRAYIRAFKSALRRISSEVRPPNFMSVLSDEFLTRKPYWVWLRRVTINQLQNDPQFILDFFALDRIPAPDVFAWYCCIYHSYLLLMGSSSCHFKGELTQWGKYLQNFLSSLIYYGVDKRFLKNQSSADFLSALLHPELSQLLPLIDKHVPSSYGNRILKARKGSAITCCFGSIIAALLLFAITHEVYL